MTTRQIFRVLMNFLGTSKQQKVVFLWIFDHLYSVEAYLYSCSNFQGVGKGIGDSINEEAYNHQRGLSTFCIKSIVGSHQTRFLSVPVYVE
jgi:hypothetical protein